MIRIGFIFFLLCTGVLSLRGQVFSVCDSIVFSGVVFDAQTGEPLPDATCRLGKGKGTMADGEGRFRVQVRRGDSVLFTYVGYRPCPVVVPDSLLGNEYMIGVFMSPDTLRLSEVLIVKRWGGDCRQDMQNARNNMRGILRHAYDPNRAMDADMNQRMMINGYARRVEMKGHVDVGVGVGTQSWEAYKRLQLQKKMKDRQDGLIPLEVDFLKKIYYSEKRRKQDD